MTLSRYAVIVAAISAFCAFLLDSSSLAKPQRPAIWITETPPRGVGGPDQCAFIAGGVRVTSRENHCVVIYTYAGGTWWVQPWTDDWRSAIDEKGQWSNQTHLGSRYAVLL